MLQPPACHLVAPTYSTVTDLSHVDVDANHVKSQNSHAVIDDHVSESDHPMDRFGPGDMRHAWGRGALR